MKLLMIALPAVLAISACSGGSTRTLGEHEDLPLLARASDTASGNRGSLQGKKFSIAILPDGCQAWLTDNGIEGYATNRVDPVTGKPNGRFGRKRV